MPGYVERMKRRWVANGLPDYPMWIAAVIDSAALATGVVVVAQRAGGDEPLWVVVGAGAARAAAVAARAAPAGPRRGCCSPCDQLATAALMLARPVDYDFAPFFLVLMVGHVTGTVGARRGGVVLAAGLAVVVGLAIEGTLPWAATAIWAAGMVVSLDIGVVLRSQQLRLEAQSREHAVRERQAVLEERQRIAREVHDLVAHSLSVTMLHLTAARRDLEDGGDTSEAVESLREAERVGRQAVSDVRRTVGLLGSGGAEPPAPTVETSAPWSASSAPPARRRPGDDGRPRRRCRRPPGSASTGSSRSP